MLLYVIDVGTHARQKCHQEWIKMTSLGLGRNKLYCFCQKAWQNWGTWELTLYSENLVFILYNAVYVLQAQVKTTSHFNFVDV